MRNLGLLLARIRSTSLAKHAVRPAAGVPNPETLHSMVLREVRVVGRRVWVLGRRRGIAQSLAY